MADYRRSDMLFHSDLRGNQKVDWKLELQETDAGEAENGIACRRSTWYCNTFLDHVPNLEVEVHGLVLVATIKARLEVGAARNECGPGKG